MAEVLLKSRTNGPNADHWKIGDIVAVRENGFSWGRLETKEAWVAAGGIAEEWPIEFFLLKMPNVTVAQVEYFLAEFPNATATQGGRRLWKVDTSRLNQAQIDAWIAKGTFTTGVDLTEPQAKSYIRNKQTDAAATW